MQMPSDISSRAREQELLKIMSVPITKSADMVPAETMNEAKDIITMSVDKFAATKNYELMAKLIKETMDKKFGQMWHCVIGEGFGFDAAFQDARPTAETRPASWRHSSAAPALAE